MTRTPCVPARQHALALGLMTLLAWPLAAQATADWTTVAPTCTAASLETLDFGLTSKTGGFIRAGRNPPVLYFCPVHPADDFGSTASWNTLKLQYKDPNATGGNVTARLYRKSRSNGGVSEIARVSSIAGPGIQVVSQALSKSVLFTDYAYYITIEMALESTEASVEAHMVMLTTE